MARDFESFIVDPSLLDPSIDATDLRTTTDTRQELLSDVPDYAGIQFDPTQRSYISDLYALYSGQLPMMPEVTASNIAIPLPGGGGGGENEGGISATPITPSTPITTDLTDEQINEFAMPTDTGGITSDPIEMENISSNPYDIPMDVDDPGASIENIIAENPSGTIGGAVDVFKINETGDPSQNPGSTNVGDQPMAAGPFDYLQNDSISTIANPEIFDSYAGVNDPQVGDPGFTGYTPSFETQEQESTVQNILGKAGQTVQGALTELGKIPGAIVDIANQTVDVFGKKLNVGKTLAGFALNKIAGGPVSLILSALPPGINITTKTAREVGLLTGDTTVTQDKYGINTQSAFGDYDMYNVNRVDFLENKSNKTPKDEKELKERKDYMDKQGLKTIDENIDEGIEAAEDDKELEDIGTEAITADDAFDDSDGPSVDTGPVGPQFEDPGYADPGVDAEENQPDSTETDDDFADDFDDGTMTGDAGDSVDDVLGPMPDKPAAPPSNPNKQEGAGDGPGSNDVGGTGTEAAKDTSQGETGYGSCFIAGTKITMADGTFKNIEDVVVGDKVKGQKEDNTVLKLDPTLLGDRKLYSFNNKHHFFTSEHPFMTEEGWKSVKPEKTKERDGVELYEQLKGELKVGDRLVTDNGLIKIKSIDSKEMNNSEMPLYNFNVSNDNSYIADNYVVHNKGGNNNGKIVCTMMNESYGFGSFRNKIWLRHSKGLAPEYQKGYHKIFLPLVKLSKKNIVLKKVLEHIAVHRTIDIRQESRGKVHLLGRVYRKILEPICYWVGKYAKR